MKMRFPHDDEPEDPSANDCNYNFPQVLFAFCLGFTCMFVLSVDEIQKFKGCPFPEYFDEPRSTVRSTLYGIRSRPCIPSIPFSGRTYRWYGPSS